ncbi:hypothetical protein [Streptomyces sp. NPDC059176]|uniref:hypothetical protein n=1 Tax=unclassified Streptomyces TaxID=2593676 RepID=UPI00368CD861
MAWTVLYIAFGIVALWLLGEVLLQYKARLRWRLVAFVGFLGVVVGVLLPNVVVIGAGAITFAVGQTYVTLSFRRGFSTGWALGGSPGSSRRRRSGGAAVTKEPTLEVTDLTYEPGGTDATEPSAAESTAVYEPQPLPEETTQYGVYSESVFGGSQGLDQGEAPYGNSSYSTGYSDAYFQSPGYEQPAAAHDTFAGAYDYGTGQQQYPGYSDPYGAGQPGEPEPAHGSYDGYGGQQYADPYATQQGYNETPPGGVWVPQQRDGDGAQPLPPEQSPSYGYPQPGSGYEAGYNGQTYRY